MERAFSSRILGTLLLGLLLWAPTAWAAPTLLVVGDSLSAARGMEQKDGWVALLQQRLQQRGYPQQVVNASVSGETTAGGRARIVGLLEQHHPQVVMIELGGNDGLQGLPLDAMGDNLAYMIEQCLQHGAAVILIGVRMPPNYGPDFTKKFHDIYRQVASHYSVRFVPFLLQGLGRDLNNFQSDGIHPTAAVQPKVLDNVWPALKDLLDRKAAAVKSAS